LGLIFAMGPGMSGLGMRPMNLQPLFS